MQVVVKPLTDIDLVRKACSFTTGKDSNISIEQIARCEHSPLRTLMFWIEMYDIPTFVSVHLVRHKIGVEHFVKSNREDRPGYTGDSGRMQPVNHAMLINAQELIFMARKRLCAKAHPMTQMVIQMIKEQLPWELAQYMVPECTYRGGVCYELKPCGKAPAAKAIAKNEDAVADSRHKSFRLTMPASSDV